MKFTIIPFLFISLSILAQEKVEPLKVQKSENDGSSIENILKSEDLLDQKISEVNTALKGYYKILFLRLDTIPGRTIVSRGITKGDECIENPNQAETGNCLKVEQFDAIDIESKNSHGSKSKQIILFFDIPSNTLANSDKPAEAKLTKIKTKILMDNFALKEKTNLEIIDTDPLGKPSHDDKIFVIRQIQDFPANKNIPLEGKIGIGKFGLDTFDNTDPEPIRFTFKQKSYLKSLVVFDRLLGKIYDLNDLSTNNRTKTNVQFQKKSLEY